MQPEDGARMRGVDRHEVHDKHVANLSAMLPRPEAGLRKLTDCVWVDYTVGEQLRKQPAFPRLSFPSGPSSPPDSQPEWAFSFWRTLYAFTYC